jgi:hypothetical protein
MLIKLNTIVEALDVIEAFSLGLNPGTVNVLFDELARQNTEERFSDSVIPTVPPVSCLGSRGCFTPTAELVAAKLTYVDCLRLLDPGSFAFLNLLPQV